MKTLTELRQSAALADMEDKMIVMDPADFTALAESHERLRMAIDPESLRRYHDLSFADPPSYHDEDVEDLRQCQQCCEKYLERVDAALAASYPA